MCFSASASFAASAALASLGTIALLQKKNKPDWPLIAIPFIFAIQQASEGFLWLSLDHWNGAYSLIFTCIFLFFAFLWWPAYMPAVTAYLEQNKNLKKYFKLLAFLGITYGATLYAFFLYKPQSAFLVDHSVCYGYYPYTFGVNTYPVLIALYFSLTFIPGLFSSHRIFRVFSSLSGIFAAIAMYFYTEHFTSVWCFFAAILSMILLYQPKKGSRKR